MKRTKIATSILLSLVMMLAMSVTAFAEGGTITISNAVKGTTYSAYKIFDATYSGDGAVSYTIPEGSAIASADGFFNVFTTTESYVSVKSGVSDDAVIAWLKKYVESASLTAAATATNESGAPSVALTGLDTGIIMSLPYPQKELRPL